MACLKRKKNVNVNSNGSVFIRGLENPICLGLISAFNGALFQNRTLTCTRLIPLTPPKASDSQVSQHEMLNETVINVTDTAHHTNDCQESVTSEVSAGAKQLERRRSVKDLVTDFSSCLSNLSSEEDTVVSWVESGGRRKKKKKRGASSSPAQDIVMKKVNNSQTPE